MSNFTNGIVGAPLWGFMLEQIGLKPTADIPSDKTISEALVPIDEEKLIWADPLDEVTEELEIPIRLAQIGIEQHQKPAGTLIHLVGSPENEAENIIKIIKVYKASECQTHALARQQLTHIRQGLALLKQDEITFDLEDELAQTLFRNDWNSLINTIGSDARLTLVELLHYELTNKAERMYSFPLVDPEVFKHLPRNLQEQLSTEYLRRIHHMGNIFEQGQFEELRNTFTPFEQESLQYVENLIPQLMWYLARNVDRKMESVGRYYGNKSAYDRWLESIGKRANQ